MCLVRHVLDAAIKKFPELEKYCSPQSEIISDVDFESAVVKIQCSQQYNDNLNLSSAEIRVVAHLLKPGVPTIEQDALEVPTENDSNFKAIFKMIKKQKLISSCSAEKY